MVSQDNIAIYDTDDFPARKDGKDLCETRANIVAATRLPDAPLASLLLLAYNRLEKTKLCIESILKYTSDIDYELILFDNGSTDGTFEYFMSLEHPRKKIVRVTKNHTRLIPECVTLTARYIVGVNNDIVVTRNWLSNLIKCAESDCRIGMIVPAMSNVSNVQEVDLQFNSLDDMQKKAAAFNVSDPGKWHERLRLVTPLYFIKKECADLVGLGDYGIGQFMDDDWIFNLRHAGYKAVLCKDTFVHHNHDFRNSEDRDADEFEKLLLKGRESFRAKHYGVDAWDDVNNYELNMIEMVKQPTRSGTVEILGIDVRCGTPILEVKNRLRGFGVFSPRLSALSEDSKYYLDLKTICEGDVFCAKVEDLRECFENRRFNYIVLGAPLNMYNHPLKLLKVLLGLLTE
jgi:GT2 family glycosyltransferase